jgi:iron(III) transport system substrate-binding protein
VKWWICLILLLGSAVPAEAVGDARPSAPAKLLTIYGTTGTVVFEPVLQDFQQIHPEIEIDYEEIDAASLYQRYLHETKRGVRKADLLLSSSMDLQVKLVNDGYAASHISENGRALPDWARWRDEAFGFTFEPAVMVFNRPLMEGRTIPRSRRELLESLRRERSFWRGRIGSYDISQFSVRYLLASQDARQSSEFGALIEAFRQSGIRIDENTSRLLDLLERGELAMGYNLLASYVQKRIDRGAPLEIVYPQDYTLVVARTAVLPKDAPNPAVAHAFLEYLLSQRGQAILTRGGLFNAIRNDVDGAQRMPGRSDAQIGPLRPIALGPGLLVYLDQQKRRRLLENWQGKAIEAEP